MMLLETTQVFNLPVTVSEKHCAAAIIVAAGSFTRMGGIQKQLTLLSGMPVIAHTIRSFQNAKHIGEIVVVARPEDVRQIYQMCQEYQFDKVSAIVTGGSTRQQSVFNGIRCITAKVDYYAIHDGARPLIQPDMIDCVIESAWHFGAAAAAVPVKDTVKIVDGDCFVASTPDRSRLWCVQTPQVFDRELYVQAMQQACVNENDFTDDCQLIEQLGHKVYLVKVDYNNIKITTPEDIVIAQGILNTREPQH